MLTPIGNKWNHRDEIPKPGVIVRVKGLCTIDPKRRWIVESYPLCDGALYRRHHFSLGIHTCNIRSLDNRELRKVSGIWLEGEE